MPIPSVVQQAMQSDRFRLEQLWRKVEPLYLENPNCPAFQKWMETAEKSSQLFSSRQASVPQLEFDTELPITAHRQQLIDLLQQRQTLVVCGETGSGKSTQLPKICLQAGLGRKGMIGHTQPRRLAARAVAARLAVELNSQIGGLVGFKIRFADATNPNTLVKVMTDGILLAETQGDRFFDQYDAIIIDEAHERSLNIDFLLGYLRRVQAKRPDLKLIITSATIDPERFANHFADQFGPAPIVEVSGRTYPVEVRYQPPTDLAGDDDHDEQIYLQAITHAADELLREGRGDILVFLPTERDIRASSKHLRGHFAARNMSGSVEILPLYARLSQDEQNKIFAAHSKRRIILATNVAESSLTVPGIHYVIDTGLVRLSRYAARSKVQRLPIEPISQASANQRSGRCGRLGPGVCIRLYEESDYQSRPHFTTPEIRRSDLANVMLQSYMLRLGPLDEFPLLEMPTPEAIRDSQRTLRELGAIDTKHQLTKLGNQLGRLPCDVRVGRMLLEAHERQCLTEVTIIAAGLEAQDARQRPAGQRSEADAAHHRFRDPHSDFLAFIRLWDFYEKLSNELGRSRLQKALNQNFLSLHAFREWSDIIRQLRELLASAGMKATPRKIVLQPVPTQEESNSPRSMHKRNGQQQESKEQALERPKGYEAVHQSLLAGMLSGIAMRGDRHEYKAAGGLAVSLWPGSGLFRRGPKWIVAAEIVETSQRFARTIAELDVEWIENAAGDLLKHSYSQPHWSEKTGAAMVYRKSTLFGLTLIADRRVPLAPIDAEQARSLLIEHGLVEGQWRCDLPFYKHNVELIADMEELVRRTRSRRYIVDHYHLSNFYHSRLPAQVVDLTTLRNWTRPHQGTPDERKLWLQENDLIDTREEHPDVAVQFPNAIQIGNAEFPLSYHFEPGHERDGVTIRIPQIALRQVSEESLGWLVRGVLAEKIAGLIKLLPKALRTNFVPAPDVSAQLASQLAKIDRDTAFSKALAKAMSEFAGITVQPSDLDVQRLPDHLRFRIEVIDNDGKIIAVGRDIAVLTQQHGLSAEQTSTVIGEEARQWTDRSVRSPEDLDEIPNQVVIRRGGVKVAAYSALADTGKAVEARLVDTPLEAERLSMAGTMRLFAIKNDKLLRTQVKNLPGLNSAALALGSIIPFNSLQAGLQDLIARIAFVENQPLCKNSKDFGARQNRATVVVSMATQEVASWLPNLGTQFQDLRLRLEKAPSMWSDVTGSIRQQLADFFQEQFLQQTPWQWLKEYPRYLQAARMRLEKLTSGGLSKDQKLSEPLVAARAEYRALIAKANDPSTARQLAEVRWLIEEFQVSIFAQQLGTRTTVSAKRIHEALRLS